MESERKLIVILDKKPGIAYMVFVFCVFIFIGHKAIASQGVAGVPEEFQVDLNKSRVIQMHKAIKKVSMGNPRIADIVILKGSQIYILGKRLGTTNVQLWDSKHDLVKVLNIEVTHDLYAIKKKLHELIPDETIEVYSSQKSVVLKGQVSSLANMDKAVRIARSFALAAMQNEETDKKKTKQDKNSKSELVINLLTIGGSQQVMLKVTVAEIERSTIKKLGIKWYASDLHGSDWRFGGVNGGGSFPDAHFEPDDVRVALTDEAPIIGPVIDEFLPNDLAIGDKGIFASFLNDDLVFAMALEAAKDDGTAKILAEPTLTSLSGKKAKFISGGEFPIPVPDDDGISISFKEFGIAVEFLPIVLSDGNINLELSVSASQLTDSASIQIGSGHTSTNFFVPALTKRSASTSVELADGQSIGLAGLINENMRGVVTKFPGLGDIPILGHLFRSEEFEKGETELVIMVTPILAKPMDKKLSHLPTDSFVEPSDIEFYLLGRAEGQVRSSSRIAIAKEAPVTDTPSSTDTGIVSHSGGVSGQFGHGFE